MKILKALLFLFLVSGASGAPAQKMPQRTAQQKLVKVAALIQKYEAQLSAVETSLQQARTEESAMVEELGSYNQQLIETVHYLRHATQYSPLLAMLSAAKPEDVVHSAVLLRSLLPEIHARNQYLLERVKALSHIRAQLEAQQNQLRDVTFHYHQERDNLSALLKIPLEPALTDQSFDDKGETFTLLPPVVGKLIPTYKNTDPKWEPFTQGVLFSTRKGAQVVAPLSGTVSFAGEFAQDQGKVVIIETSHSHVVLSGLGSLNCKMGQKLLMGEPIGRMPTKELEKAKGTGQAAPQLYLEIWRQEQTVDPQTVLSEKRMGL